MTRDHRGVILERPYLSMSHTIIIILSCFQYPESENKDRMTKIREALEALEIQRSKMLMERQRIGCVSDKPSDNEVININCKKVTFGWQRGFKIGTVLISYKMTVMNQKTITYFLFF